METVPISEVEKKWGEITGSDHENVNYIWDCDHLIAGDPSTTSISNSTLFGSGWFNRKVVSIHINDSELFRSHKPNHEKSEYFMELEEYLQNDFMNVYSMDVVESNGQTFVKKSSFDKQFELLKKRKAEDLPKFINKLNEKLEKYNSIIQKNNKILDDMRSDLKNIMTNMTCPKCESTLHVYIKNGKTVMSCEHSFGKYPECTWKMDL